MQASELRIGNLVYDTRGDANFVTVDALRYIETYIGAVCQAKPIPLTAEWLEKFGFDRDYDSDSGWRKNILREWVYLYCDTQGYFEISVSKHSCPVKIKYVHQLQNLFFALTGEDLTIKS